MFLESLTAISYKESLISMGGVWNGKDMLAKGDSVHGRYEPHCTVIQSEQKFSGPMCKAQGSHSNHESSIILI